MTEHHIQTDILQALNFRYDCRMFRNNCGVARTDDGRVIRYGVASPGGADLIGWRSVTITPDMVGRQMAVFTAIEVKSATGRPSKDQENFLETVRVFGGLSGIARSVEQARSIIA